MDLPLALQNVLDSPLNNLNYEPLDLSSKVEYALLALLALANHSDQQHPLTIGGITAKHGISERYLEQILTMLRRGGIVHSQRGARGGYTLTREPRQINLLEVIALIDGTRKPREHLATPLPISCRRSISLISRGRLAVFNRCAATNEPLKPAPTIAIVGGASDISIIGTPSAAERRDRYSVQTKRLQALE